MIATALHPKTELAPGRYHLDADGRLHPNRPSLIAAVAIVNVRERGAPSRPVLMPTAGREDAPMRSMARREKPTPVHLPADVKEALDEEDAAHAEFVANLAAARKARGTASQSRRAGIAIDGKRLAAAMRAKARPQAKVKAQPTERAKSREACLYCGAAGANGCDHFLPFEAPVP